MIKNILFDNRPQVKGLNIPNSDTDRFEAIYGAGIPRSEVTVMDPVITGKIDPALTDVRHDPNCRVATIFRSLIERAVLNRVVKPAQTNPVNIITATICGSAAGKTEV